MERLFCSSLLAVVGKKQRTKLRVYHFRVVSALVTRMDELINIDVNCILERDGNLQLQLFK